MHIDLCHKHDVPGEAGCMFCACDYLENRVKELQGQLSHFMPSNPEGPFGFPWHLPHYDVMWADNERYKDALNTLLNYYSTLGPEAKEAKLLIEDALRERIYTCPVDVHRKR